MSAPADTRNPHDTERTPGGSSSGSAAAVADAMVTLAVGSQTGGSVIRPASFCGIHGYKPSFGAVSRNGMHLLCDRLCHAGVFARSLDDIALIGDVLTEPSDRESDTSVVLGAGLQRALSRGQLERPRVAFVRGPIWDKAEPDAADALMAFAESERLPELELPGEFDDIIACHARILAANLAANFGEVLDAHPEKLRDITRARIEVGLPIGAADYIRSVNHSVQLMGIFDRLMYDYDAVVTLAAPGQAPTGLHSTGDPVFCAMWTLLGAPSITVPRLRGVEDLPIGLQVIGRRGDDERVIQVARWLERHHAS